MRRAFFFCHFSGHIDLTEETGGSFPFLIDVALKILLQFPCDNFENYSLLGRAVMVTCPFFEACNTITCNEYYSFLIVVLMDEDKYDFSFLLF